MGPMIESEVSFADTLKNSVQNKRENLTASLILGNNYSSSLASSRTTSTTSSGNNSRVGTPPSVAPHCIGEVERCNCCTVEDFWKVYDSFHLMDKRGSGLVRRSDFYEASTEHVTLEMRRTITRGDLHQRFRSNAADMTLQELLQRVWPNSTADDQKKMNDWAKLRDASLILKNSSFQGSRQDLKKIFDLLDADGSQTLSISELVRARIITKAESQNLLQQWFHAFTNTEDESNNESRTKGVRKESRGLNFNDFCKMTQKHLCEKYVQKDVEAWQDHCRKSFATSRAATQTLIANREGREVLPNTDSTPQKGNGLKTAGLAVLAPSMFNHNHRNLQGGADVVMAC